MTLDLNQIIYPFQRSITNFQQDPTRSSRYLKKSRFMSDLDWSNQILTNLVRFQPDLAESGQFLAPVINPRPTQINSKSTRPEPKNPTKSPSQFRVKFLSTRLIQVESGSDTNLTRLDPWTALVNNILLYTPPSQKLKITPIEINNDKF